MKNIQFIKDIKVDDPGEMSKDIEVNEIFNGDHRRLVEVRLRNGAVLSRHKAAEPITVQCLSGSGVFTAGPDLDDKQDLRPGILLTLEAEVEHEVTADPELHILVSKFKMG
ncbi:MAG TPA: hypothetical protein VHQ01_03680 [Pyrinomonadaceae bacterium]|nr:hypothetical protein [Pyrinomonadaceae bacterium]